MFIGAFEVGLSFPGVKGAVLLPLVDVSGRYFSRMEVSYNSAHARLQSSPAVHTHANNLRQLWRAHVNLLANIVDKA